MKTRRRSLPAGWYPDTEKEVKMLFKEWNLCCPGTGRGFSAVVPHAGWYYSGKLAAEVIAQMDPDLDTLVVAGGHLPANSGILCAVEDEFEVPGGKIQNNRELTGYLSERIEIKPDNYRDNTVEIQLPLIKAFWPEADVMWVRVPPDNSVRELAGIIYDWTMETGKKTGIIGSTDLTHYGSSYGYIPAGSGKAGLTWVKEKNDAKILEAMINLNIEEILKRGNIDKAACSSGAAALAAAWAQKKGAESGRLVNYYTSYDIQPAESFVGYGGIVYE